MISGIGVDMVKVPRMEAILKRWGSRFMERIFTPGEIRVSSGRARPASAFALRFAAKEAFSKALGLGMTDGLRWKDVEVVSDALGRPGLRLHGRSSEICRERSITGMHLSLTDEGEYGIAVVVLEGAHATG
jgi:holo-[acyl-carrier protein] synthase